MKRLIILYVFALVSLTIYSQGIVKINVNNLNKENDSLVVNYRVEIGKRILETEQSLQIKPMIQAGDSIFVLPEISILGKNKQKVLSRFDKESMGQFIPANVNRDTLINYNIKIPYTPWMDSASLVLMQEVQGYRGKNIQTISTHKNIIDASSLKSCDIDLIPSFISPQKIEKQEKIKSILSFEYGHSAILSTYKNNLHELNSLYQQIQMIQENPLAIVQTVHIIGYASPGGNYYNNERIARKRAQALTVHLRNRFGLDDNIFKISTVAEDWDGLVQIVKEKDISYKDEILSIIATTDIGRERNRKLQKLSGGNIYRKLLSDMFPLLPRVECQIDYELKDNQPDKAYCFSEDSIANNNAAAVMISRSKIDEAKFFLEKAGNTAQVLNNRGVISLLEGDLNQAESYFMQAIQQGNKEAITNLEQLRIEQKRH